MLIRRRLVWRPSSVLFYKSPIAYLREFMLRPGYADMNEHWRDLEQYNDPVNQEPIGCDFYDFAM